MRSLERMRCDRYGDGGASSEDETDEGLGKTYYVAKIVELAMHGTDLLSLHPMLT